MADHVAFARMLVNQSENGFKQLAILLGGKLDPVSFHLIGKNLP